MPYFPSSLISFTLSYKQIFPLASVGHPEHGNHDAILFFFRLSMMPTTFSIVTGMLDVRFGAKVIAAFFILPTLFM